MTTMWETGRNPGRDESPSGPLPGAEVRLPLTVIILTLNEERNLPRALSSIAGWAPEVFVLDSGSSDAMRVVAEGLGARVFVHGFEDYSKQRNFALRSLPVKTEWVFFLDADE